MAGYTESIDGDVSGNKGSGDVWIVKFTGAGSIIWQKTLGGYGNDRAYSLINTADGGFAVAGRTTSNNGDVSGNHPPRWQNPRYIHNPEKHILAPEMARSVVYQFVVSKSDDVNWFAEASLSPIRFRTYNE